MGILAIPLTTAYSMQLIAAEGEQNASSDPPPLPPGYTLVCR